MNDLLKNLMNTRTYRWARRFINNLPSRGRKKSAKRAGLENFKLDRLEERILLSADPVTEIVYDTLDQKSPVELVQTPQKQLNQPIINALVLDMKNLEANQAGMDSVLSVSTDTVLGGSGDLNLEVINSGVVAPGYSPGVQNVASYTQNPGGTLEIEIAGYGAAGAVDGFDQINVSGSASLGGTLSVSLLDGFKPKVGDTFDIMTYGSVSGNFDAATGIFGFESDYYFDIVQKADRLQLVVKEVFAGDAFELVSSNLASFDDIGSFLIQDYLSVPTSVTFSGSIDLGSAFSISGEFTLGMEPTLDSVTLADESVVGVDVFTLIGRDVTATMGGSFGLSFTGMDFGLAVFDATDDDRSWISATGSIDSVALFNLPDLSISAENFELDVFWALGPENDSVIDFSSAPLTLADGGGTIAVLDQDGSLGNRISAGGDVSLSLPGVTVEGELAFSSNSDGVFVLGSSVDAGFSAFGLEAGVRDATFGIMLLDSGVVAEGSGSLHLSGGGFTLPAGDSVSFKYNNSNEEKSDQVIIIGSRSFTFSDMPASEDLIAVSVSGFEAELGGVFHVSGDFGFQKNEDQVLVVAQNASVTMQAGPFSTGVTNANLGMVIDDSGKKALEARGGAHLNLNSVISASVDSAKIFWNETGDSYTGVEIQTAALSFTFSDLFASSTLQKVVLTGAELNIADFITVSGNLAVEKDSSTFTLSDGTEADVDYLAIGGSDLNLKVGSGDLNFAMAQGAFGLLLATDQADSVRRWMALSAEAEELSLSGIDNLVIEGSDILVELNRGASDGTLLDLLSSPATIGTGSDTEISLFVDGALGELTRLSANLDINVANFFTVSGGFALEKSIQTVTLDDGSEVEVDLLSLGADGASAFVGLNGGTSDALGFELDEVNFALALLKDREDSSRKWMGLQADAKRAEFVGIDNMTVMAGELLVLVNQKASDGSVINFSNASLELIVSPSSTMVMDMNSIQGEMIRVSGNLDLNLFDFFTVSGGFSLEKYARDITLSDGTEITADLLTLGASDVDAFVGLNGGSADEIGFLLEDVNLALALMTDQADRSRKFTSLYATAGMAGFVGLGDDLSIAVTEVKVEINKGNTDDEDLVVDFSENSLSVTTSASTSLELEMDGALGKLLRVSANLDIKLGGFFTVQGGFALEKSSRTLTLSDGSSEDMNLLTLGATQVDAFAGIGGGTDGELGFRLSQLDMALAIATSKADTSKKYTSLYAESSSVAFVGIPGLTISADTIEVLINKADADGLVVDYAAENLAVMTSSSSSLTLDIDGSRGNLVELSGNLNLSIFDFLTVSGGFAFVKQTEVVVLADGSEAEVDLMTLGSSNVSAFAGLNGGSADQLGLALSGLNFGLAIMKDRNNQDRSWLGLKGNVGSVSFDGIDGLTLAATDMVVEINRFTGKEGASKSETTTTTSTETVTTETTTTVTTETKTNTVLLLNVSETVGSVVLSRNGSTGTVSVAKNSDDATLRSGILSAVESLNGIGSGNVLVTGTRADGFKIELTGDLEGAGIDDIEVQTTVTDPSVSVTQQSGFITGQNEIQVLNIVNPGGHGKGTFTFTLDGKTTHTVRFDSNAMDFTATQIRKVLEGLPAIGKGNVTVTRSGLSTNQYFTIEFKNRAGNRDVSQLVLDTKGLKNATASMSTQTGGTQGAGETQRVSINHGDLSGSFQLSLNTGTKTIISESVSFGASADDVARALNNVLRSENASVAVSLLSPGVYDISFNGSLASANLAEMQVNTSVSNKDASLLISFLGATETETEITTTTEETEVTTETSTTLEYPIDVVVDFAAKNLEVLNGPGSTITLDTEGERGNLISVGGQLTINLFDFFMVEGDFAFEKYETTVTLSDESSVAVNLLTLGANEVSIFVGANGDSEDRLGLAVDDADFALAMFSEKEGDQRSWLSLKAEADFAGFVGIPFIELNARGIAVNINTAAEDETVIDYGNSELEVKTGPDSTVAFDFSDPGEIIRAEMQRATMAIGDFVHVSGGLYLEKASNISVNVQTGLPLDITADTSLSGLQTDLNKLKTDGYLSANNQTLTNLPMQSLTLGAGNVDIFVGLGPYFVDSNGDGIIDDNDTPDDEALGFVLEDIDFGMVLLNSEKSVDPNRIIPKMFALKAFWPDPIDIDWGFFEFEVRDLMITVNQGSAWSGTQYKPFANFYSSFGESYTVSAPGMANPLTFNFQSSVIGVSIGFARLSIENFFTIEGSFAFEKLGSLNTDIVTGLPATIPAASSSALSPGLTQLKTAGYLSDDNSRITGLPMDVITLGGADVNIFVGDVEDPLLSFENIDFAVSLFKANKGIDTKGIVPNLYSFKATIPDPVDIDWDFLIIDVDDLTLKANSAKAWKGTDVKPFVDFTAYTGGGLSVATGADPVFFDYNRNLLGVEMGNALINIADFFFISGSFSIEKTDNVVLDIYTGFNSSSYLTAPTQIKTGLQKMSGLSTDKTRVEDVTMTGFRLGGENVNAFLGMGPYFVDSNGDGIVTADDERDSSAVGFAVDNLDFAVATFKSSKLSDPDKVIPTLFALYAEVDSVGLVGLDFLNLEANGVTIKMNQGSKWKGQTTPVKVSPWVDFQSSFPDGGYEVATGGESLFLNFRDPIIGVAIADAFLRIDEFVYVRGGFLFEKGVRQRVVVDTGANYLTAPGLISTMAQVELKSDAQVSGDGSRIYNLEVETTVIGLSQVDVFVGYGIPDFDVPFADQEDIYGFGIKDVDMALAMMKATAPIKDFPTFLALSASSGEFELFTGTDFLELSGQAIDIEVNRGTKWKGTQIAPTINFKLSFPGGGEEPAGLVLEIGGRDLIVDFEGPIIGVAVSDALFRIDSFIYVSGDFSFRKGDVRDYVVKTTVGTLDNVNLEAISVGVNDAKVFVGMNGPYFGEGDKGDSLGIYLNDVDLGLAMFKPTLNNLPIIKPMGLSFIALKAHASHAGVVGLDSFMELELKDITVELNMGSAKNKLLNPFMDLAASGNFEVKTGGEPVILDYDSRWIKASVGLAKIRISEFLYLHGSLAFTKGGVHTVKAKLGDIEHIIGMSEITHDVETITIGGQNLYGFVGINGPYMSDTNNDGVIDSNDTVNTDAIGLSLEDVNFGVAIMTPTVGNGVPEQLAANLPKYMAVKADVGRAALVGFGDFLDLQLQKVSVNINTSFHPSIPPALALVARMPYIDFGASFADGYLAVPTGADDVRMDFTDEILQAKVGYAQGNIAGILQLSGSIAFTKRGSEEVVLTDGSTKTVTSLALGVGNAYGFVGYGGYWQDSNNDGKIDELDTPNSSAVGLAIEELNLGAVFMRSHDFTNLYVAAKADLVSASFVGVDGVTLAARDLSLDLNASPTGPAIDFSKSGKDGGNYAISTGEFDVETGEEMFLYLDYDEQLLAVQGSLEVNFFDLIKIDGAFDFSLSDSGLSVFVDGDATIGSEGTIEFTSAVTGLLVIEDDIALKLNLSQGLDLGSLLQLNVDFTLTMNSFGRDYVYVVPEKLRERTVFDEFVISATPPGELNPAEFYVALEGSGSLSILDILNIEGEFSVVLSDTTAKLNIGGMIDMPVLEPIVAAGTLGFADGGLYGSIQLGNPNGQSTLIDVGAFSMAGSFLLQINTTPNSQQVKTAVFLDDGTFTGFEMAALESELFYISGSANITVAGFLEMYGSAKLKITSEGFEAELSMGMDLGAFGSLRVAGAAAILNTNEGPVFAMRIETEVELSVGIVGIRAAAIIEVNTSNTTEYAGVAAGTTFRLALDGALKIVAFDVEFQGEISYINNIFELRIDNASLDFFGFIEVSISGYVRSNGKFSITGEVDFGIDMGIIELNGGLSLTISDSMFRASVYASLDINIDFGFFSISETLAGFSGTIEITEASAYLEAKVTVVGISVSGSYSWSWGAPPIVSHQVGDTVYLNMGTRANLRGDRYLDIIDESYHISQNPDKSITVMAMGQKNTYTGVKRIVADGANGNDTFYIGSGVDAKLVIDGGSGNDVFFNGGGVECSVIRGGAGNDTFYGERSGIHYYGDAGNDTFIGGDGDEIIDMGTGNNKIFGNAGKDTIYVIEGNTTVDTGSGDDEIFVGLNGYLNIKGGSGYDVLTVDDFFSDDLLHLNQGQFRYKERTIDFDDSLELIKIRDTSSQTVLKNNMSYADTWGSTGLYLHSDGVVDVRNAKLVMPRAHLTVIGSGIQGTMDTEVQSITVKNTSTGAFGDIVIRERDGLVIKDSGLADGGLFTSGGNIDVELASKEATLLLESGVIRTTAAGGYITIVADDIDFNTGRNKVTASGQLTIYAYSSDQNYRIGGAAQSAYGNDYSPGYDNGFLNLSMKDLEALSDGFSKIVIGQSSSIGTMYIGDVENAQKDAFYFEAKFKDHAELKARRINVVGDVQGQDSILMEARLIEIQRANQSDPLGVPDSGVTAREALFEVTEQMLVTGWIKGQELVRIRVLGSTGQNVMVGYGSEVNSLTTDLGSSITSLNNGSRLEIETSHSIQTAAYMEALGTGSEISISSGTGIQMLEGSSLNVKSSNSSIQVESLGFLRMLSGSSVLAGARIDLVDNVSVPVKLASSATVDIVAGGEMLLAGAITAAGAMNLEGGASDSDYADYFDTIPGRVKASTAATSALIDALRSNVLPSDIRNLITSAGLQLGATVTLDYVAERRGYFDLTEAQQLEVANALGYSLIEAGMFFNPSASGNRVFVEDFTMGDPSNLPGYTFKSGIQFYNPLTRHWVTTFEIGEKGDYDNSLVDWGSTGTPAANAGWSTLSAAQKAKVAEHLGYVTDNGKDYYNLNATFDKRVVQEFKQGKLNGISYDNVYWGEVSKPAEGTTFSSLSLEQKRAIAHTLGYEVYEHGAWYNPEATEVLQVIGKDPQITTPGDFQISNINWGGVIAPEEGTGFDDLSLAQKEVVLANTGYRRTYNPVFVNNTTGEIRETMNNYNGVDWGDLPAPAAGTIFEKLSTDQQKLVLETLDYRVYTGLTYVNSDALLPSKRVVFTLVEGQDYTNAGITWSTVIVPDADKEFQNEDDSIAYTEVQQKAVLNTLGYTKVGQDSFYNASADLEKRLVTGFIEGVDYNNGDMSWGTSTLDIARRFIVSDGQNEYLIYLLDEEGDGVFDQIQIQEPHYLLGQRGYGVLMTGTINSLQDNETLVIGSEDDTIVRGNINILGNNSNLTLQSDKWVYFEGVAKVSGDLKVYGGVALDGTSLGGANDKGSSVFIHSTATLYTTGAGTDIEIFGGKDVDINGRIVAGGTITSSGVNFSGNDSTILIRAGEQIFLDSILWAAKSVTLETTAAPAAGDNSFGVVLTTASGITAAGLSSDGQGGLVKIDSTGGVTAMGVIMAGGQVSQQNDEFGNLISESTTWHNTNSRVELLSDGQLWLGGITKAQSGNDVEIGGVIRASGSVVLSGGTSVDGISVRMPGSAKVAVHNAAGSITVNALQDADLNGLLVAGGEIVDYRDSEGVYLGSLINTFGGASEIHITAGHQIRVSRDLYAGKVIDMRGGVDPVVAGEEFSGKGVVIGGTTHLKTWSLNSQINISAQGDMWITAPAWTEEIVASGFIEKASGKFSGNVSMDLEVDLGTHKIRGMVSIPTSESSQFNGLTDVVAALRNALKTTQFEVIHSPTGNPAVGTFKTLTTADPEVDIQVVEGRLMFISYFKMTLHSGSTNANLLGFSQVQSGSSQSSRAFALDASAAGSVINIGRQNETNGQIYIAGKLRAHSAVNLYSGVAGGSQNFTLDSSGVIETLSGGIVFNPGDNGVFRGELIARGRGSDIVINSKDSLEIHGKLTAQDEIIITAGTNQIAGERSIHTFGTSVLSVLDDNGKITLRGINDVYIDSSIGADAANLRQIDIESTTGDLTLAVTSGRLETGAQLNLKGNNVTLAGVIESTRVTSEAFDWEINVEASTDIEMSGNLLLEGSLLLSAGRDIVVTNTLLLVNGEGQRFKLNAGRDIELGTVNPVAGTSGSSAVVLQAHTMLDVVATGMLKVGYNASLFSTADNSNIRIQAGSASIAGSIRAGAQYVAGSVQVFVGQSANLRLVSDSVVVLGGQGLNSVTLNLEDRGGRLEATGAVDLRANRNSSGLGINISSLSSIRADATGSGELADTSDANINIYSVGELQIYGEIRAVDDGADATIRSDSLIMIDHVVGADDQLLIAGGSHSSRSAVILTPTDFDGTGLRIDGAFVFTEDGGSISILGTDDIYLRSAIGKDDGSLNPATTSLTVQSTSGSVTVTGNALIRDQITIQGKDINVMQNSQLITTAAASSIYLKGSNQIYIEDALTGLDERGLVQAVETLHVSADIVTVRGDLKSTSNTGRVLVNASTRAVVTGAINSNHDIDVRVGVGKDWILTQLTGAVTEDGLSGGSLQITGTGFLQAAADVNLLSGGEIRIGADSADAGTKQVFVPVINTYDEIITVSNGFIDVALPDPIAIPVVTYTTSLITEWVGRENVKVGQQNYRMDVALEQVGYYNPNAAADKKFREFLIEGIDYFNDSINWLNAGDEQNPNRTAEAVTSDYKDAGYKTFTQLSDAQKQAVLNNTGYMKLFDFSYSNAVLEKTFNGVPTNTPLAQMPWHNNELVIYRIDVAGWKDKFIRMPKGAQENILNVVFESLTYLDGDTERDGNNQGSWVANPGGATGELVGRYHDQSDVRYTQDRSNYYYPDDGYPGGYNEPHDPIEDGRGRWVTSYEVSTGQRHFDIANRSDNGTMVRDPNWYWEPSASEDGTDPFDNSRYTQLIYGLANYNSALNSDTQSLVEKSNTARADIDSFTFNYWGSWETLVGH